MPADHSPEGFLDKNEAAEVLGIHPESLLRAIRRKTLKLRVYRRPAERTHNKFFFDEEQVHRLKAQRDALRS